MPESMASPELTAQPLTAADFRRVAGNYATGIAVVTTIQDGAAHAMTANSFTTVSLNPLLVSFCVQHGTRFRAAVSASGFWAASFLTSRQTPLARWFAKTGRPLADQFHGIPIFSSQNGSPVLAESLGAISATTVQAVTAGDHDILIGLVSQLFARNYSAAEALDGKPSAEYPIRSSPDNTDHQGAKLPSQMAADLDSSPCVYFQSAYGSWLREPSRHPNI